MVNRWQNLVARRMPHSVVYFDQTEPRDYPSEDSRELTIKWYPPIVTGTNQIRRGVDHILAEKIPSRSIAERQRELTVKCFQGFMHKAILLASGREDIIEA
jgi:hypothetical protein